MRLERAKNLTTIIGLVHRFFRSFVFTSLLLISGVALSQSSSPSAAADPTAHGRLLLIFPFENRTSQPNFDWIGEGAADILNRRLDSAGFLTISRGDRL